VIAEVGGGQADRGHADRGCSGQFPAAAVADVEAFLRFDVEPSARGQIDLRVRLADADLDREDLYVEQGRHRETGQERRQFVRTVADQCR
jgi:hypothetical protein